MWIILLRLDIHRFVVVSRIDIDRQIQLLRIGAGKPGVAVRTPLHGRANTVAISQIHVVTHSDLIAVVDDRRSRQ